MAVATTWLDLAVALVWPVAVLLLLVLAGTKRGRSVVGGAFDRITKLKLGAFELELGAGQAEAAGEELGNAFAAARTKLNVGYDRRIRNDNLRDLRTDVVVAIRGLLLPDVRKDFRSTIHVPDVLFVDAMYQLLEYYPQGDGRGRAFPVRMGMLGRAWRSGVSEVRADIPIKPEELVREWGMTIDEAESFGRGRKSFVCAVLRNEHKNKVAIFYLDSAKADAFGTSATSGRGKDIVDGIEHACKDVGLITVVEKIQAEMKDRGPAINVYGQH